MQLELLETRQLLSGPDDDQCPQCECSCPSHSTAQVALMFVDKYATYGIEGFLVVAQWAIEHSTVLKAVEEQVVAGVGAVYGKCKAVNDHLKGMGRLESLFFYTNIATGFGSAGYYLFKYRDGPIDLLDAWKSVAVSFVVVSSTTNLLQIASSLSYNQAAIESIVGECIGAIPAFSMAWMYKEAMEPF